MYPEAGPGDNSVPNQLCDKVVRWLELGRDAGKFVVDEVGMNIIEAVHPTPGRIAIGQFPKCYVVWSSDKPTEKEVCSPLLNVEHELTCQLRLYTRRLNETDLTEDTRDWVWALATHLRLNKTLGGFCEDLLLDHVSGDVEYLIRSGIQAHGIVEFRAIVSETFTLDLTELPAAGVSPLD